MKVFLIGFSFTKCKCKLFYITDINPLHRNLEMKKLNHCQLNKVKKTYNNNNTLTDVLSLEASVSYSGVHQYWHPW